MKNKSISDVVLVYDRYYANKPNSVTLSLKRVGLCSAVTLCAMMYVLMMYAMPVNGVLCAALSVVFAAAFSVLFIFVKKRFAIPAILLIAGMLIWLRWESFCGKITYFFDEILMLCSGRFVDGSLLLYHYKSELSEINPEYIGGVTLGTVLLIMLFAMITAAGSFSKPHTIVSFLAWIVLWVPLFLSESFTFNWWLVPAVALYMGAFASSIAYRDGLTLRSGKGGSYTNAAALNEQSFMNRLAKSPYIKRVEMRSAYYSKYFSLTMYAAAVFAVIGIVAGAALGGSKGIDYAKVYEFVTNLGSGGIFSSPFEDDSMNSYFTKPFDQSSYLSISSPGRSNREVLRVRNPGSVPVYLRGDYGIDFLGDRWDTPSNPVDITWNSSFDDVLKENYRPAEMKIMQNIIKRGGYYNDLIDSIDITVDYLYDTNVVFLPAYTDEYSYYDNEMFDIYGDFVTRVDPKYNKIDKIECTALVPKYSNMEGEATQTEIDRLNKAVYAAYSWNFDSVMESFLGGDDIVSTYRGYINSTFMNVPEEKRRFMEDFLRSSGLQEQINRILESEASSYQETRYRIADAICTYLVNNYTYSLDTNYMAQDQIEDFLTKTKSGHCALYATSMTLMLRTLGIPARYCTGFVAPPNGGTETVLRSRNLHAWCEVYLDQLGWVTFDPTSSSLFSYEPGSSSRPASSSSSSDSSSSVTSGNSREDSSSDDEESDPDEPGGNSGGSGHSGISDDPDKQNVNVLPYIMIILAIVAAAALVIFIIHYFRSLKKRARKAVRQYCRDRKADVLLEKIIALLEVGGLTPQNGELPGKFYKRAEKTLRCAFSANKDMLEAVAFGDINVTETDCESLSRLFEQLYNALEDKMYIFEKVKLWKTVL